MKTMLAVLVTALVCSTSAFAVGQAVTPKQFNALAKRVKVLERDDKAVLGYVGACLGNWTSMARYTNYLAIDHSDGTAFETTGIDMTDQGETPGFFTPTTNQDCTLQAKRLDH